MRKLSVLISLCLFCSLSYSQNDFIASYLLVKSSVIYVGVSNPISIISNRSTYDYDCSVDNGGRLVKSFLGSYDLVVDKPGYYNLTVKPRKGSGTVSYTLRAKDFPNPSANLQENFGGKISRDSLIQGAQLQLNYNPAIDFDIRGKVISFSVLRISDAGKRSEINNEGAEFSAETIKWIAQSQKDDILIFSKIKGATFLKPNMDIADVVFYIH